MPYSLTEWAIGYDDGGDGYRAPEQCAKVLHGICPARAAQVGAFLMEPITTSAVVAYDPETRVATTASGSKYRLEGEPKAEYAEWCKANGYDPSRVLGGPTAGGDCAT